MTYEYIPEDADFSRFWKAYPKKMAKADAKKAWQQTAAIRPATELLVRSVIVQSASPGWMEQRGKFIPYPASWLRGERWADVPEVELRNVVNGQMWHKTASGIEAKGAQFGLAPAQFVNRGGWPAFKQAVLRAVAAPSNVVDLKMRAAGD